MSINKFFSRQFICKQSKIRELITEWTKNEGWDFYDFTEFLTLIGISYPIKVTAFNKKENSFKWITEEGEIEIALIFGDLLEELPSIIKIKKRGQTKCYGCYCNLEGENSVHKIELMNDIMTQNNRILISTYWKNFFVLNLGVSEAYSLNIALKVPDKLYIIDEASMKLRNMDKVQEYLLMMSEDPKDVSLVYEKVAEIFEFSKADIAACGQFSVSYVRKINHNMEQKKLAATKTVYGKIYEKTVFKDGEIFHVCDDGSWSFVSKNNDLEIFHYENQLNLNYELLIGGNNSAFDYAQKFKLFEKVQEDIKKYISMYFPNQLT